MGKDFFALFVKFFASLGLKDPMFATVAWQGVGIGTRELHVYGTALVALLRGDAGRAEPVLPWNCHLAGFVVLFSMADQVFGDRFQLLEHGLFWMVLLASWIAFKFFAVDEKHSGGKDRSGRFSSLVRSRYSAPRGRFGISQANLSSVDKPVLGVEIMEGMWNLTFISRGQAGLGTNGECLCRGASN